MERFISDQSSMTSHPVVNYSSSSSSSSSNYGGFLFRSPNSPPLSPTPSPPPSIASLSQLFLDARFSRRGSHSPVFCSSPACFQLPKPPLLPLPRSATLPAPSKWINPAASSRSRRHNAKRKGKLFAGFRNQSTSPPPPIEEEKDELRTRPIGATTTGKREMKLIREEEEMMESVFSLSPPPSSLPFPTFSLRAPKANSRAGVSGYCIA